MEQGEQLHLHTERNKGRQMVNLFLREQQHEVNTAMMTVSHGGSRGSLQ